MSSIVNFPRDWVPRNYQLPTWQYFQNGGTRSVNIWHRRAGKDLLGVNLIGDRMLARPGLYWHLFPTYKQGRKIAWNGMTKEGRKFRDHLPIELLVSENNTEMSMTFQGNRIYQVVGSDNVDSLVGSNPVGVILSEYALQDPRAWEYLRPILVENGGWALFLYTPRGFNHGYKLYQTAQASEDWHSELCTVEDTNAIPLSAIEEERQAGMAEDMIQQEFYCSFTSMLVGSYYGQAMAQANSADRVGYFPYDPLLDVHTAWDLGMNDETVIIFYQLHGSSIRIIDCHSASGEALNYYAKICNQKEYSYGRHALPHDVKVRELGTGRSRYEILTKDLGFRGVDVTAKLPVEDGIEAVRSILPRIYWNKTKNTEILIDAVSQYRKEYDDKNQCFKNRPVHDWTSNFADALRTLALSLRHTKREHKLATQAESEYDYFGV